MFGNSKNIFKFAMRHSYSCIVNTIHGLSKYAIGVVSLNSFCNATGGCRNSGGLRSFYVFIIVIILLMRHPVKENCNIGNDSTYTATPIGATSVSLNSIIDDFILWDNPQNYVKSLELLIEIFLTTDESDETNIRWEVWHHYTHLRKLLSQLENLNPRNHHITDIKNF